jgi:hypothetical protein
MTFLCSGERWLDWSPENKVVTESGEKHNCPKAPWNLKREGKIRARVYKETELQKINDFAILAEIHDKVRYWNSRLVNYTLDLQVIPKKQLEENEWKAA